ncbi:class I adenylate-forming enzyme family protein [Pseudonocardia halophobica]|uniref:class I adenylate-forming enzyme family protein n=1 Tax=Pseudonocardia halophobica TaxID=29401 RepID=UPI003D8FE36C
MLSHSRILAAATSGYGARPAVASAEAGTVTYAELAARSRAVAAGLLGMGLQAGDRVVWLSYNRVEYLYTYYGTALAGLALAPLNYWLRPTEIRGLLELLEPKVAFVERELLEPFTQAADGVTIRVVAIDGPAPEVESVSWDAFLDAAADGALPEVPDDALHEIVFTSGTTGQSKGVMRSQRKRIIDSLAAATTFRLHRDDHLLGSGPQFHIGGGAVPGQLLVQGGRVTIMRRFDPGHIAAAIGTGVTYFMGVPAHFNLLFASGELDRVDTRGVRGVYLGGSVATLGLFERIREAFPNAEISHGYGSTESGPHSIGVRGEVFLQRPGTIGLPVPGTEVRVEVDGRPAGPDEVGELVLRAPTTMDGYYGRPQLTATVLDAAGWYRTGDLVRRDADGYFYVADRKKDMIISGGENVYSREVEDVLSLHPAVDEVAVIGTKDPIYEECVTAVVRLRDDAPPADFDVLRAFVRERLAGYKAPRRVEFVDEMPRNPVGKIDKLQLREQFGSVFAGSDAPVHTEQGAR